MFIIAGSFAYVKNCGIAKEIQAYAGEKDNVFLFGTNVCPQVWGLGKVSLNKIKDLPKDKNFEIISYKENSDIEKILSKDFLGYNKLIAGEGAKTFVIYETIHK